MRQQPIIWGIACFALLAHPVEAQSKYVGVKTCARCHDTAARGSALHRWQTSKHAEAFRALTAHSEGKPRSCQDLELWVVEIGRGVRYGLPRPAADSKECLPCHTTAFGVNAQLIAPSFDPKDGVQCESCHGPGSAHVEARAAHRVEPAAMGWKRYEGLRAIQAQCQSCHEGTCGDFDFSAAWPKIQHSPPRVP